MAVKCTLSIGFNISDKTFEFYYCPDGQRITHESVPYKSKGLDEDFYKALTDSLQSFIAGQNIPSPVTANLVLPGNLVFSDTISVLNMGRKGAKAAFNIAMAGIYKNMWQLRIATNQSLQNKRSRIYSVWGTRKALIDEIGIACAGAKCAIKDVTFSATAASAAAVQLNPKLKNATYMFLDIKNGHSDVSYIYKGRAIGTAILPFGTEILRETAVQPEDMLFDHPLADLTVLNAKEKAKMKTLTMMEDDSNAAQQAAAATDQPADDEFVTATDNNGLGALGSSEMVIKTLPKKSPRKLPQYMQRPVPEDETGIRCENFRVFTKWTLIYIQGNDTVRQLGAPEAVYVNLPSELNFILNTVNAEAGENGLEFRPAGINSDNEELRGCLDLYGATAIDKPVNLICLNNVEEPKAAFDLKSLFSKKSNKGKSGDGSSEDITAARVDLFSDEKKKKNGKKK